MPYRFNSVSSTRITSLTPPPLPNLRHQKTSHHPRIRDQTVGVEHLAGESLHRTQMYTRECSREEPIPVEFFGKEEVLRSVEASHRELHDSNALRGLLSKPALHFPGRPYQETLQNRKQIFKKFKQSIYLNSLY